MPSTPYSKKLFSALLQEFGHLSAPLFAAGRNPVAMYRFLHQLGWDFDTVFGVDTSRLLQDFKLLEQTVQAVFLALDHDDDAAIVQDAHDRFKIFIERLENLFPTLMDIEVVDTLDAVSLEHAKEFGKDLAQHLVLCYLYQRVPLAFSLGKLFGLIVLRPATVIYPGNDDTQKPIRFPLQRPTINWQGLLSPHTNPFAALIYQIDFAAITSWESFLEQVQSLFQRFVQDLYRAVGKRGLDGMTVSLNATGLGLIGGNRLPFPQDEDPPIVVQLAAPGSPQFAIDQQKWRFSWLPNLARPDGSVVIFAQDWVKVILLPALASDDQFTSPGLYLYENADGQLTFEVVGGMGVEFPLDMLVDDAGNAIGAGARGRLVLTAGARPQLTIDEMAVSGNFRFGGADGLAIQDARLAIQNIVLPMPVPDSFPFAVSLSGTLVLPDTAGRISVALAFDKEQVHFRSSAEIHLGNGIWLHPVATDRPVLEMVGSADGAYSFRVAALFKVPREGAGCAEVEVSGTLDLERTAGGIWQVNNFNAYSLAENLAWELPGNIILTNAGIWLSYDGAIPAFKAGISGGFSLSQTDAAIAVSLEFLFPNLADPTDINIRSTLDIDRLPILDQVYFFNLDLELSVWTQTNGGVLDPSGYVKVLDGVAGLFPKEAISASPQPEQFHLVITAVQSMLRFQTTGFEFELTSGDLLLPEIFFADITGTPGRASIGIGDYPLRLVFEAGTGLAFKGSLLAAQIGLVTEQFNTRPKPGIYFETAQLFLPDVEIPFSGPVSVDLPQLVDAYGQIVIPVSQTETLNFGFADFSWNLAGIPQGVIYLIGNTDIQLGGGFVLSIIGETPTSTGLSLYQTGSGLEIEIMASVRLTLPVGMLTDAAGDTISIEAGGKMKLHPGLEKLEIYDLSLAFIGNFHLGGADGFLIENGRIEAIAVENMLAPTADNPFEMVLSGTLTLPNGPKGGLENARFIFNGEPLPRFDLDGITGGTGNIDLAGDYLPLTVKEIRLHFDPARELPEKLYPLYTTANIDAELNIGDVLSGAVEDLEITFDDNGIPSFSVDSIMLRVDGLEMGSFVLGGGLGIGGLNDIPDSLVLAGNLKGKFNGTGIEALAAFGIVDGLPAPLGAALGAQMGPGGIPLWASGFLLTGAKGGISYTGGNSDPDNLKNYIIVDETTGRIASQPRPEPEEAPDVEPGQQKETGRAPNPPEDADLDFHCPDEPCPPPSVGILYEPHPDSEAYPHRIIVKFSSLQKSVVDDLLAQAGIAPAQLQAMTPETIATRLSNSVVDLFTTTLPFLADQIESMIRRPMKALFLAAAAKALAGSTSVYEVILREAYKGLRAPNLTVKLTGIVSYTGISSFLAVEGGVVISPTVQSAGIVGNVLLLGIPVGRLRAFLTLNNELGMPDPALCGDLAFSLGPLDLGYLRLTYKYGVDFANLGTTLVDLIDNLEPNKIVDAMAQVDIDLFNTHARNPVQTLQNMSDEQRLAFIAQMMQQPFTAQVRNFLLALFDASWDNYHPQLLLCGSAQPKLFGLPLDGELVGVSAMADKTTFQANFRFSPSGILSKAFYNILPAIDRMSCSVRTELPEPRPLIAAGLTANFGTDGMAGFLHQGVMHVIDNTQATIDYEIAPLGLKLANAEARMLLPCLQDHPAHPDSKWKRPEDRPGNYPSRMEVLMAALDDNKLGNIFWKGTNADLNALTGLAGRNLGKLELHKDYFPHGGILGSGRLMLPIILLDAPPVDLFNQLFVGSVFQRVQIALQLINEYILTTRSAGQLAFFIPAPNPPVGAFEHALDLPRLLAQVRSQDFNLNKFEVPELYPRSEVFLKGFLGTPGEPITLLGVPVGSASIELAPPDDGTEGHFTISSAIPANSWVSAFVERADLNFTIRKKPAKPVAERFSELRTLLQKTPNKTAALNSLIVDLNKELPKISLSVQINNLRIPKALEPVFGVSSGVSAHLYGYSPWYDYKVNFRNTDLLSKAKNDGGLVLEIRGSLRLGQQFGLSIQSAATQIGIFPSPVGFPDLSAHLFIPSVGLPAGLPALSNATINFNSQGGGLTPLLASGGLSIKGTIQKNSLELNLHKSGGDLALQGDTQLSYIINGNVGPIYEPVSGTKLLDTLTINSNFIGDFSFLFQSTNGRVDITKAHFAWNGRTWRVPNFSITIGTARLNWPARMLNEIKAHAFDIFEQMLNDPDSWMESLQNGIFTLKDPSAPAIVSILKSLGAPLKEAAQLLSKRFTDAAVVIKALFDEFGVGMLEVLKVLRPAGFTDSQAIADAIFTLYKGAYLGDLVNLLQNHWVSWPNPIQKIMSRLLKAGFNLQSVLTALKNAFGSNELEEITVAAKTYWGSSLTAMMEIAQALKNVWGSSRHKDIARALKLAWDGTTDLIGAIANALKNNFALSHQSVMEALKHCGFGSYDVAAEMKDTFNATASTVAEFLKNSWGKNSTDITRRLRDAGYAAKYVAKALEDLKYPASTAANRLKEEFSNLSHTSAMEALKYAGFNSSEVTKEMFTVFKASALTVASFLKNEWNKGYDSILSIMTGVGYAHGTVVSILNGLF